MLRSGGLAGGEEHAALIARVLAIPAKRHDHATVSFLTRAETEALLAAPGGLAWAPRPRTASARPQTEPLASELTGLTVADARLGTRRHAYCRGKGPKERYTPLTAQNAAALTSWLAERGGHGPDPQFCT